MIIPWMQAKLNLPIKTHSGQKQPDNFGEIIQVKA